MSKITSINLKIFYQNKSYIGLIFYEFDSEHINKNVAKNNNYYL